MPIFFLILLVLAYVLGSISFGQILAKRSAGVDLTEYGSGNTGASNAYRTLGWKVGLGVLVLDLFKGTLAVFLAYFTLLPSFFLPWAQMLFGLAVVLGHNYSVFRKFEGGKGIATTFGVALMLSPKIFLMAALLWISGVGLTRMTSVASLLAVLSMGPLLFWEGAPLAHILFGVIAALFGFYRHKANLIRLRNGEELTIDR